MRVAAHDDEQAEASAVARTIAHSTRRSCATAAWPCWRAPMPSCRRSPAPSAPWGSLSASPCSAQVAQLQPVIAQVYRLGDGPQLRTWAQDALETDDTNTEPDDSPTGRWPRRCSTSCAQPVGDGPAFRAWVDATDPFGQSTQGVELLTFHGAKGREWHTVLLVGCETSLVPHRSATTNAAPKRHACCMRGVARNRRAGRQLGPPAWRLPAAVDAAARRFRQRRRRSGPTAERGSSRCGERSTTSPSTG